MNRKHFYFHSLFRQESIKQEKINGKYRQSTKTLFLSFFSRQKSTKLVDMNRKCRKSPKTLSLSFCVQARVDKAGREGEANQVQEAGRREGGDQVRPQRKGDIEQTFFFEKAKF